MWGRDEYHATTGPGGKGARPTLTLRLEANPEKVEEDLERRERRHGENYSEQPRYLTARVLGSLALA
jgi:hypothetical protein